MAFGVNRFFRRRYGPAWLTLGLGLAASAGLSWQLHREAVALDQQRFKLEAYHIAALLESTMERYEERVGRLADHCAPFDELPTQIWNFRRSSMTDLDGNLPNVVHAVYCLKIPATGFEAHATRGREKWKGGYAFDPQAETGRAIALPVWQYWSRQGFEPVVRGSDMAQEADWHPSLLPALTTARGWISPSPVRVKRADGKATTGFWFALALFKTNQPALAQRPGESLEGFSQRRAAFIRSTATGMLAVFISTDRMLDDSYNNNPQVPHRLHARLYTSREPMVTSLLNPVSQAPVNPRYYEVIVQSWYGRRWALELMSTPQFEADSLGNRSWLVLAAGTGMTLLASALVAFAFKARNRQELLTEQIGDARDALSVAQQERERFSRDLHDSTIQSLYAIQLGLGRTTQQLETKPDSQRELAMARRELDTVIAEIRRFIAADEEVDTPFDLGGVLDALVQRARVGSTTRIQLHFDPEASDRLDGDQAVQLANIAREALSNSLRHAKPDQVAMTLRSDRETVVFEVSDDGVGFDPKATKNPGVGLGSMAARAQEMGGTLNIQSSPGQGTRLSIRVPASVTETTELE